AAPAALPPATPTPAAAEPSAPAAPKKVTARLHPPVTATAKPVDGVKPADGSKSETKRPDATAPAAKAPDKPVDGRHPEARPAEAPAKRAAAPGTHRVAGVAPSP
ncbi:MAG: hypothetical protein K2X71_13430, partial [Methylobacterium sp.]|nr:hypothetical protein [Methylobacterium sp.]